MRNINQTAILNSYNEVWGIIQQSNAFAYKKQRIAELFNELHRVFFKAWDETKDTEYIDYTEDSRFDNAKAVLEELLKALENLEPHERDRSFLYPGIVSITEGWFLNTLFKTNWEGGLMIDMQKRTGKLPSLTFLKNPGTITNIQEGGKKTRRKSRKTRRRTRRV